MSGLLITIGDRIVTWLRSSRLVKSIEPSEKPGHSIMYLYLGPPIEMEGTPEELWAMLDDNDRNLEEEEH